MDEGGKTSEDEVFWRFSLAFYERPGVADALVALQDRDGFDVNLVLFVLWLGISGHRPLDGDVLAGGGRAAGPPPNPNGAPFPSLPRQHRHPPDRRVQT